MVSKYVRIPTEEAFLLADLEVPAQAPALVLFAHDRQCRNNPRNQHVAWLMRERGLGTLLCDLLTDEESADDEATAGYRNNAPLLAARLVTITRWVASNPDTRGLKIGYFGACAGGTAALIAASKMRHKVGAIVTRDVRLDLAPESSVSRVTCPTLVILGANDTRGIELNQQAIPRLACTNEVQLVPGASYLFGEPGKLVAMAQLGAEWFHHHLARSYNTF